MQGAPAGPGSNSRRAGEHWRKSKLPPLIDHLNCHRGVNFLVRDEGRQTDRIPFLAIGPGTRPGCVGSLRFKHAALLRTVEALLQLPVLAALSGSSELGDRFLPGAFPSVQMGAHIPMGRQSAAAAPSWSGGQEETAWCLRMLSRSIKHGKMHAGTGASRQAMGEPGRGGLRRTQA